MTAQYCLRCVANLLTVVMFWPMQAAAQAQNSPTSCAASYYWLDSTSGNAYGSEDFNSFVRIVMRSVNGEFDAVAGQARANAHRLGQAVDAGQIPVYAILAQAKDCSRQYGVPLSSGYAKTAAKHAPNQSNPALEKHCMSLLADYERSFPSDLNYFAARMRAEPGPEGDAFVESVMKPLYWYQSEAEKAGCPSEIRVLMSNGNHRLSKLCYATRTLGNNEQSTREYNQEMQDLDYLSWLNKLR